MVSARAGGDLVTVFVVGRPAPRHAIAFALTITNQKKHNQYKGAKPNAKNNAIHVV
jgi:hypothetical protein